MTKEGWLAIWATVGPFVVLGLAYGLKRLRLYVLAVKAAKAAGQPAPPFNPLPFPFPPNAGLGGDNTDSGSNVVGADKEGFMNLCSALYDVAVQHVASQAAAGPDPKATTAAIY